MVEIPGIEPGVPEGGGFTVHCITIDASSPQDLLVTNFLKNNDQ
jgi:hypothetical protein